MNATHRLTILTCLGMFLLILTTGAYAQPLDNSRPFRLAFSASLFNGVNEMDIRAAMKVWIMTIVKDLNISVDPNPNIQPTVAALAEFGLSHQVDGFGLTTPELVQLSRKMPFDRFAVGTTTDGRFGDEYLLIVHGESGIQRLDNLKGTDINVLVHSRMSLAMTWLETLLLSAHLGLVTDFFSHVNPNTSASQVVLPVFFRKNTSCLITRAVFDVMAELNPQLQRQLHILAVSPNLVPAGFAFRADTVSPVRPQIFDALKRIEEHHAGRQLLTIVQSEAMENYPISILDESLALIAKHRQLCGTEAGGRPIVQSQYPTSIVQEKK